MAFKAQSVNSAQKFANNIKKTLGVSAVVAGLLLGATNAAAVNAISITTNQTIGGSVDLRAVPTALTETYFFQYSPGRTNSNIMSSGANSDYNGFMRNKTCNWNEQASSKTYVSVYDMQEYAGTCSSTNGTTLYGIENWRQYGTNTWNAIDISGGATVNITGDLNNIVFASYRRSMYDRNSMTGTDKLINLTSGTLNVGTTGQTATINIGFGTQNVWVRDNSYAGGAWGNMNNTNTKAASMHNMGQIVIDVSNSTVNFNQPTKIITVLDATGNEPWYNTSNTRASNSDTFKMYNYKDYHDKYNHRALRLTGNARANINNNVTTTGVVEVAGTSSLYINSGGTLQARDLISTSSSTTAVYNNEGTLDLSGNLSVTNGRFATNSATNKVTGTASFTNTTIFPYYTNTFNAGTLSLTNTNVNSIGFSGSIAFSVTNLNMSGSTFNGVAHKMTATNSNLRGTNNFYINARTATPINLGITTVESKNSLRVLISDEINSGTSAYTAATNAKKSSNKSIKYTYGTDNNGNTLVKGNGVNNSTVTLLNTNTNAASATALVLDGEVSQASGLTQTRYRIQRDFTNVNGVTYYSATVTDLTTVYNPSVTPTPPTPVNPDPDTPEPTPITPDTPTTPTESGDGRMILTASPILQGLVDVNFLLAQFDLVSKYQTNFNPDSLVDNRKRTIRKQREMAGYDRRGRRVIKTTKKTRYTEYDYNVWADAQYSNVTFDNGLGQNLQAQMLHNKVGADITAGFDGYYRAYVGYNYLNAKNQANDNTYQGSSYEGGVQVVADLSIRKFDFKTYADVAYAYNNIGVHAENLQAETGAVEQVFDDKLKSHSIKAGVGVEKMMRFARALDVGVAVDLDYVFQMGNGISMPNEISGSVESTPNFQIHSFSPGVKLFGGYNFRRYGTYVYVQGTAAYQILGQDEWLNIDSNGQPYGKVANAKYPNLISTAGIGVTQKVRRNFNISAAVNKIFSNAYTNNALQGRLQVSYRW